MAYNTDSVYRIEKSIAQLTGTESHHIVKKNMFGGISFLFRGKMTVGMVGDDLAVRVVPSKMDTILKMEHVRPMDFTKRPMKEFIFVSPEGFSTDKMLQFFVSLGLEHARQKTSGASKASP